MHVDSNLHVRPWPRVAYLKHVLLCDRRRLSAVLPQNCERGNIASHLIFNYLFFTHSKNTAQQVSPLVILCICLTVLHCCFEWIPFGPLCLAIASNVAHIVVYDSGLPPFMSGHSSSSSRNLSQEGRCQSHCLILEVSCAEHPGRLSAL